MAMNERIMTFVNGSTLSAKAVDLGKIMTYDKFEVHSSYLGPKIKIAWDKKKQCWVKVDTTLPDLKQTKTEEVELEF